MTPDPLDIEDEAPDESLETEEPTEPERLQLFGRDVDLQLPLSVAERLDVLGAAHGGTAGHRLAAAALGLCYRRLRSAMQRDGLRYAGDVPAFGGQVLDFLLGKGAAFVDVAAAGRVAVRMIVDSRPGEAVPRGEEADALLGKSGGTEASTS